MSDRAEKRRAIAQESDAWGANFFVDRPGTGDGGLSGPVDDACAPAGADSARWQVHRCIGTATELHQRPWPAAPVPSVWVLGVTQPALVLGSTQAEPAVAPGIEVVRRRSGGGAVLVRPGSPLWVDVVVPSDDHRWHGDVGQAFGWLGRAWVGALRRVGVAGAQVHEGALVRTRWSDAVCFAGLGPGEVTVGGRKVVGMSQRRTREAALFQCAALFEWAPAEMATLLGLPAPAADDLAGVATGLPVDAVTLETAFLAELAQW